LDFRQPALLFPVYGIQNSLTSNDCNILMKNIF